MYKGGLGRGLGSLISGANQQQTTPIQTVSKSDEQIVKKLPTDKISANPWQPREFFGHQDLEDLVESIKRHGILQPLIVTESNDGNYVLVAGERRLRAAKMLDLKTVPCLVRSASEQEQLELALIENIQRSELNPVEEANAYKRLMDEFDLTQEEVAAKVGKKRATVANALRLLDLPAEIKQALLDGRLGQAHGKLLLSLSSPVEQKKLFKQILALGLTVREAEAEKGNRHFISKSKKSGFANQPPLFQESIEKLRSSLGTKVKISGTIKSGTINIDFYSADELRRLTDLIAKE
jgi:ParB family chromosome partitioning protein